MDKIRIRGICCSIFCAVIFGFSYLFTKQITGMVTPVSLLGWRFMLAFAALNICVLAKLVKIDFKGKSLKPLLVIAVFQPVIYFTGETVGISLTSASESGTVIAIIPLATLACSFAILKEKPRKVQILGISITAAGISIIVLMKGMDATFNITGYFMLFMAVISYSLYTVYAQKATEFSGIEKTYIMIALGAVVFFAAAVAENTVRGSLTDFLMLPFTNTAFLIAIVYLGIGSSVMAFFCYNMAVEYIGSNSTASFVGISTIVTVISGVILLKEPFSLWQGLGTILVVAGVYTANIRPRVKTDAFQTPKL